MPYISKVIYAFEIKALSSVVAVLPDWPSNSVKIEEPEGSAVAILPGGYLVTNNHVLGKAISARIRLGNGREVAVDIVGRDSASDIALIKAPIDIPIIKSVAIAHVGNKVCAVGNQFGLGMSVTCGVVSAVKRTGIGFNRIEDFIQTDAAVNPGGSGGALVNSDGNLVGLVSAIFTKRNDANIGVNFATSMRLVDRVIEDLRAHGRVIWKKSGIIVKRLPKSRRLHEHGIIVEKILPLSEGEKAGLNVSDVIISVAGRSMKKRSDFISIFNLHRPGSSMNIVYRRANNEFTTELVSPN